MDRCWCRCKRAFKGVDVVHVLQHLVGHLDGTLLSIWDGAPIHRDKAVTAYLAAGAARQLWLEPLPAYAPDWNPDEGVWNHLKHVEVRNVSCHDQDELRHELRMVIARLGRTSDVIRGFIKHYGY